MSKLYCVSLHVVKNESADDIKTGVIVKCPICNQLCTNLIFPYQCDHSLCYSCSISSNEQCPSCRAKLKTEMIHIGTRIISDHIENTYQHTEGFRPDA